MSIDCELNYLMGHYFRADVLLSSDSSHRIIGKVKTNVLKLSNAFNASSTSQLVGATISDGPHNKIEVEQINGVEWNEFVKSLFRKGQSTRINGNVIFTTQLRIGSLFTGQLNGVDPDDFLTITTPQRIETNVLISGMHVNELQCGALNNMPRFAENVALIGENNVINSKCGNISLCW